MPVFLNYLGRMTNDQWIGSLDNMLVLVRVIELAQKVLDTI